MIVVKGRIVDFLSDRNQNGYAEFIFKSDYDKNCPRFNAICSGNIPDVVPGVPIKVEIPVDSIDDITKVDFYESKIEKITQTIKDKYMNRVAYACIDYNDENYARKILISVKGISNKTADRILEAVDGNIEKLSDLWNDQNFWKTLRGSKRYLENLKNTVGSMLEKEVLFKKYQKYGIGYPQIDVLSAMFGLEAEDKLCANPYSVLYKLDLDFQVADNLAKDLGFHYLSEKRIIAMIYQVLKENESCGNTAMRQDMFYVNCAKMHSMSAWKNDVVSPYYILSIASKMRSIYYEEGLVGFMSTMEKEADIAYHLNRLMSTSTDMGTPASVFEEIRDKYNKEQYEFLKSFDHNSVTILLGRGGTGKTHTICGAIDLFKRRHPNEKIQLCAPTARAAGVLKEHSRHDASTIHIMLGLHPYEGYDNEEKDDKEEREPQLEAKLIVVDEISMVDTDLMYHILKAVKSGSKLILSGDPDQLESVGCGAVLADMIDSGVVPKIKLNKIMRQNEGSAVIDNCGKILSGKYDFIENELFKVRKCESEQEALAYLKTCYDGDSKHMQILSTTRKGHIGTMSLNKEFEDTSKEGIWLHGDHFKIGDKVIFTKNNYEKEYCNGDIGFLETISMPLKVRMQCEDKIIEIEKENVTDVEHAECITIHKSQGSEYKKVYIMLPDTPKTLLTRNMVNTAISRAREEVILVTVKDSLKIAASNRYKHKRLTRLKEKLINIPQHTQDSNSK